MGDGFSCWVRSGDDVRTDVLDRVQKTVTADLLVGNWTSISRWAGDAIAAATAQARVRAGGGRSEPPARIPNRLPRRAGHG